ncbi:hypothetical protein F2Q70_00020810 [Brassica cretica]|uniref:Uncharacterized protein n=1 Tax=Brassica cretica TaxID=69181 RepID=A0A8S9GKG2_BRACR|nr:hypothetical protein F2Q70_00020810 [Brassica cretica]
MLVRLENTEDQRYLGLSRSWIKLEEICSSFHTGTTQNIQVVTEDDLGNPSQTTKHKRTNALLMNAGSVHGTTQNIQVVTEDDLGNPSQTTKHKRTNALLMNAGSVHDLFVVLLMAMADLYIIIIIPRSQYVLILCCLVYVFSAQKKTRRLTKPNPEVPLFHPVAYCNNLEKHDYKDSNRGKGTTQNIQVVTEDDLGNPSQTTKHKRTNALLMNAGSVHDLFVVLLMAMADLYIIIIIPRSQNVLILCCLVYVFSAQKKTRRLTKPNPEVPLV